MTGGPGAQGGPRPFADEELAAIGAYLPELQRSVAGHLETPGHSPPVIHPTTGAE
jgi:hypothetical protein